MKKIEKENLQTIYYLTPSQEGILFHFIENQESEQYFEQLFLLLHGKIKQLLFKETWQLIVDNNEMLRAVFRWEDLNRPLQLILKKHTPEIYHYDISNLCLPPSIQDSDFSSLFTEGEYEKLRHLSLPEQKECIKAAIKAADKMKKFDFESVPFFVTLIVDEEESDVHFYFHHILFDGWSTSIILKEFCDTYNALNQRQTPVFSSKLPFDAYLKYISDKDHEEEKSFWQNYFNEYHNEHAPLQNKHGDIKHYNSELNEVLSNAISHFCKKNGITPALFFYGAWGMLEAFYKNTCDIVLGATTSGREASLRNIEHTVGLFINTLPLRITIDEELSLSDFFSTLQPSFKAWQRFSRSSIVDVRKYGNLKGGNPLFDTLLVIENYPIDNLRGNHKDGISIKDYSIHESSNYPLTAVVTLFSRIGLNLAYNNEVLSESYVKCLSEHFVKFLEILLDNGDAKISDIYKQISYNYYEAHKASCDAMISFPRNKLLHQMIEEKVQGHQEQVAIETEDASITYADLNRRANQLANGLLQNGISTGKVVGVMIEPSIELVVCILGILKAGSMYVPLDPSLPKERLDYLIDDSETCCILVAKEVWNSVDFKGKVININNGKFDNHSTDNPEIQNSPMDLVYTIYTSGSTGKPKGVLTSHFNVNSTIHSIEKVINYATDSKILCLTSFTFDPFILETILPLIKGIPIVMAYPHHQIDPDALGELILNHGISILQATPSRIKLMLESEKGVKGLARIKTLMLGGEVLTPELVDEIKQVTPARIFNMYGTTESTLFTTISEVFSAKHITIGVPIPNTEVYIADKKGRALPPGILGELIIGGDGVAQGYKNKPELTAKAFAKSIYNGNTVYKTGDWAKRDFDGNFIFSGRIDSQVKIRGYRIELGEIEYVLKKHKDVKDVAVLAKEFESDDKRLVAYVIADRKIDDRELKELQERHLPYYMRIVHFVYLDAFPISNNGKTDRLKLASIPWQAGPLESGLTQHSQMETSLKEIWSEVLGNPSPGINDNFFDLGGHSLLTIQVVNKIKQRLNLKINVVDLFKYTSIKSLAGFLTSGKKEIKTRPAHRIETNGERWHDIAVIGVAGRFPGAENIAAFWDNLVSGRESISLLSHKELLDEGFPEELINDPNYVKSKGVLENIEYFDGSFFSYSPRECEVMDPQLRILHECAWHALEDAGCDPFSYKGLIGFFAGSLTNAFWINNLSNNISELAESWEAENYNISVTTPISYKLDLKGPSVRVETACSSSLVAIHHACRSIIEGTSDMAIAGGVSVTLPKKSGYLYKEGMIRSKDGHCRAFDEQANGTLTGDGVGLVVLKRLDDALACKDNIYAVIKGSAINNDGSAKIGFTAPSVEGQAALLSKVYAEANVDPNAISYIEAHGTGTSIGDPIEIEGLKKAFNSNKKNVCAVGSVKSNIGHLNAAAGVAGFIKTVLALRHKQIPQSLHFSKPNPKLDIEDSPFFIQNKLSEWKKNGSPLLAGVSSFGIGGTNAHILLQEAPEHQLCGNNPKEANHNLLLLSAHTKEALDKRTGDLLSFLSENEHIHLEDVAYTLQVGRRSFDYKRAIICTDKEEAIRLLSTSNLSSHRTMCQYTQTEAKSCAFVFQNEEFPEKREVLASLLKTNPLLYQETQKCLLAADLAQHINIDDFLQASERYIIKGLSGNTADILEFLIKYCLAKITIDLEARPDSMIGDSFGELLIACISGVLQLNDALTILAYLTGIKNDNNQTALNITAITEGFKTAFNKIQFGKAELPYISVMTGSWITNENYTSCEYWFRLFSQDQNLNNGFRLLQLNQDRKFVFFNLNHQKGNVNGSEINRNNGIFFVNRNVEYSKAITSMLANIWLNGLPIKWDSLWANQPVKKVSLPNYIFEKQYYWKYGSLKPKRSSEIKSSRLNSDGWYYAPVWKNTPIPVNIVIPKESTWLIFHDNSSLGSSIISHLRERGNSVTVIKQGDEFKKVNQHDYNLNAGDSSGYKQLFQSLSTGAYTNILYLWSSNQENKDILTYTFLYSLINLLQAIASKNDKNDCLISVLTQNMEQVFEGEKPDASTSLLKGVIKVAMQEFPSIKMQSIDLNNSQQDYVTILHNHICLGKEGSPAHIALRNEERFIETYERLFLPAQKKVNCSFKNEGVYLITGGLGGISLEIVKHLSHNYNKVKLILTSRSNFPAPSEWDNPTNNIQDDGYNRKISMLKECIVNGSDIMVLKANSADYEDMQSVFDKTLSTYGRIDAIIHTAGVNDGGMIISASKKSIKNTLDVKVKGAIILKRLIKEKLNNHIDYLVFFSSINSVIGSFGQVAYVAANIFLDQYAKEINNEGEIRALSIGWDTWVETGMALKQIDKAKQTKSKPTCINAEEPYLEHFVVSMENSWLLSEHRIGDKGLMPATGYIDSIARNLYNLYGKLNFTFSELIFLSPLIVQSKEEREVQLKMDLTKSNQVSISIYSKPDALSDNWQEHVNSTINIEIDCTKTELNLVAIKNRCTHQIDYDTNSFEYNAGAIVFGSRWHTIRTINYNDIEGVAHLILNEAYKDDLNQTILHPALLDIATSFMQSICISGKNEYIPFSYRNLVVIEKLPNEIYSHVKILQSGHSDTMIFSVCISDIKGKVVAYCDEFVIKRIKVHSHTTARTINVPRAHNYQLEIETLGNFNSLYFKPSLRKTTLDPEEVEIEVFATGLNFKEVLMALGILKVPTGQELIFGLECSGNVAAKGDKVTNFEVGDPVMAFVYSGFSKYVYCNKSTVAKKPKNLSFEQAATTPLAFLTAYYALVIKGNIRKNETVLIHSAAGGVGLAAVSIAKWAGATIFATAGNQEKRDYLKSLGISHVMDSRKQDFVEEIKQITQGKGIDLVLNSLSGEALQKSLSLLAPYGRFLEIGVRDIIENNHLQMNMFNEGKSFIAINIKNDMPHFTRFFNAISEYIENDDFDALPVMQYEINQVNEAFELMASAKHIGKIGLTHKRNQSVDIIDTNTSTSYFDTGIKNAEGMAVIETIIGTTRYFDTSQLSQIIVSTQGLQQRITDSRKAGIQFKIKDASSKVEYTVKREKLKLNTSYIEASGKLETKLVEIIKELLGIDRVGVEDNLEEIGMSSLDMIQFNTKVQNEFGKEVSVVDLYTYPTVKALALFIDKEVNIVHNNNEKERSKQSMKSVLTILSNN